MNKLMMIAAVSATMAFVPAAAQTAPMGGSMQMGAMPVAGSMTAEQVGVGPMMGTPSATFAQLAADSDMYELQSSKLALTKARKAETKAFARQMIADHTTTTKALMAALPKTEPKVPRPSKKLSADNAAKIAQLRAASRDEFDAMYMQQQAQSHQVAWSLHKGYSQDGADPALRQVAASAVPIVEKHVQHTKGGGHDMKAM